MPGTKSSKTPEAPEQAHRQAPIVPAAEVPDDAHALRVRRPDREAHPVHPVQLTRVSAEGLPETPVRALGDQVHVDVADRGEKAVRIVLLPARAAGKVESEAVAQRERPPGKERGEDARRPGGVTSGCVSSARSRSARTASGWSARTTTPPSTGWAPSRACGFGCRPDEQSGELGGIGDGAGRSVASLAVPQRPRPRRDRGCSSAECRSSPGGC